MPNRLMRSALNRQLCPLFQVLSLACALMTATSASQAAGDIPKLAGQLKGHGDFRVRTQAALALGASGSESAVEPLCGGLGDKSTTVRAAAAAGLGKLNKGGGQCLEDQLAKEATRSVKAVINQSLEKIRGAKASEITSETRYYIAIAGVTDDQGNEASEYDNTVRKAMMDAVQSQGAITFAPVGETPEQSRKRLKGKGDIKGFYLTPKVAEPSYGGGNLTVKFEIALFTYPTKVLKGMLPVRLTEQGVSGQSRAREENLLRMAAGRAMEKFASQIERVR